MNTIATDITLPFAGGERRFHIGRSEMMLMEISPSMYSGKPGGRAGATPIGPLYARLLRGRYEAEGDAFGIPAQAEWSASDLNLIIFYGLIGAGECETGAAELMREHVYGLPLMMRWNMAVAILGAAVEGVEKAFPARQSDDG